MIKKLFTALLFVSFAASVQAQSESVLNVLRSDVRTQVAALTEAAMGFSDEEAEVFWPLYREFELESSKLADQRIAAIKDYADNFENMTDEKADELVKASNDLTKKRHDLNYDYYKKVRKVLSPVRAARFFQVHRQIQTLMDLQIQSELPLIQEAASESSDDSGGME